MTRRAAPRVTAREREVLLALAGGASNARIARDLGMAERTVKVHVAALMRELGVGDRTAVAIEALRRKVIRLPEIAVVGVDVPDDDAVGAVGAGGDGGDAGPVGRSGEGVGRGADRARGQRARVLVVDDDQGMRLMLVRALEDEGYEVREAHEGGAALDIARRWRPDAILLDLMMEGMDGAAFAQAYAAAGVHRGRDGRQGHGAPILVMTAAGPGAERAAAALPGVRAALGKPMDVERLYGELARLVGGATGR